jgi:Xaa-Pro aminopeptidase
MDKKTYIGRLKGVREGLSRLKADCLIVTKPANITWLTGFMGDDSWAIVLPKGVMLVTDSRYIEQARGECEAGCKIIVRKEGMVKTVAELLRKQRMRKIGVEKTTTIADFENLKKELKGRVVPAGGIVETLRRKKDAYEIKAIIAAAKIAARAFKNIRRQIRTGMTENELAGIVDFEIRKLGGTSCFETIAAFGANASRPHHRPTNRKLRRNDTVLIDFGVRHNGYCCDITRCFAVGRKSNLYGRIYEALRRAQLAAINLVKAGVEIKKVDAAARNVLRERNLPVYGHGTGHGLGLEVHEQPIVSNKTEGKLQTDDVITIEPGVYIPGKLGLRLEDDILVTEYGYILLTKDCPNG